MTLDFTLDMYRDLCQAAASSQYTLLTVEAFLTTKNTSDKFIILRHDVDRQPKKAMRMAEIEETFGIKATYYFRFNRKVYQTHLIKRIADMGHEIGYHYEVLDKAKGDNAKAIQIFVRELEEFRKIAEVNTICMHGNPFTRWVNRDLWKRYDFHDFGLIGEDYLSIPLDEMLYFSDTGRTWSGKYKIKDHVNKRAGFQVNNTGDLIELINAGEVDRICIVAHPNRWSKHLSNWLREYAFDTMVNIAKTLLGPWLRRG